MPADNIVVVLLFLKKKNVKFTSQLVTCQVFVHVDHVVNSQAHSHSYYLCILVLSLDI